MKGGEKTRSPEMVFDDFKGRRAGIIKALSTDFAEFHKQCHPDKDNMCLYGLPGGGWEVNLPAEEEPPGFPEPVLGINFARDGMVAEDWLTLIAAHSDAWLLSLAFFVGTKCGFGRADRSRLFNMINDLPTVMEEVIGAKKQQKEKPSVSNRSSSKSKSSSKWALETRGELSKSQPKGEVGEDEEAGGLDEEKDGEHDETFCGACGEKYVSDEFWICCDICEKWYHGKCVKITPARAEHIKQYKCPSCSHKRVRP